MLVKVNWAEAEVNETNRTAAPSKNLFIPSSRTVLSVLLNHVLVRRARAVFPIRHTD
jgi:hypothetical protein